METRRIFSPGLVVSLLLQCCYESVSVVSGATEGSIQCVTGGWFLTASSSAEISLEMIPAEKINDGYCDCPLDGSDEMGTGACSGSMDGMWAGIPSVIDLIDRGLLPNSSESHVSFTCPQQPSLQIPLSRVNDGICDCCDGADENLRTLSATVTNACPDTCDEVLAAERAAIAKLRRDFQIGSSKRSVSISQFTKLRDETKERIRFLKEVDLEAVETEKKTIEEALRDAKQNFGKEWLRVTRNDLLASSSSNPLAEMAMLGSFSSQEHIMGLEQWAVFIISICMLSAEISSSNFIDGRCMPLDRSSLDMGILWDYSSVSSAEGGRNLPKFLYLDANDKGSLVDFAEKLISRLEGKDIIEEEIKTSQTDQGDEREHSHDDTDDYYEAEHYDDYDDEYIGVDEDNNAEEANTQNDNKEDKKATAHQAQTSQPSPNQIIVSSLLEKIPLLPTRTLFKEKATELLSFADGVSDNEPEYDPNNTDGNEDENESPTAIDDTNVAFDPIAVQMIKSTLSKRLVNISYGEQSAQSAARYLASMIVNKRSNNDLLFDDLQRLAILSVFHSGVSSEDIAELVYTISSAFRTVEDEVSVGECKVVSSPMRSMCPPRTISIVTEEDSKTDDSTTRTYPPSFLVEAARRRCEHRTQNSLMTNSCEEAITNENFPVAIPDGYFNYYTPQKRPSSDDLIAPSFVQLVSSDKTLSLISELEGRKENLEKKRASMLKSVDKMEKEIGGSDGSKFGPDGELYILRDSCHKIISGKYEYEVCIFGRATQRDIGQKGGGTHLGTWDMMDFDDDGGDKVKGQRVMKWSQGTKCWNGPVRSAEVVVTCGAETKLLTADEPETCRYLFTMESPLGCDESFRKNNGL